MSDLQQLFPVTADTVASPSVDLRVLHEWLGVGRDFPTWVKSRIDKYGFEDGIDFSPSVGESSGGRPSVNYLATVDMAKEIGMVENSDRGREVRRYFIECERELLVGVRTMTQTEVIAATANALVTIERKQIEQDSRISAIEARQDAMSGDTQYMTVLAWTRANGIKIPLREAQKVGASCSRYCADLSITVGKVPDERFGAVNSYPVDVISEMFDSVEV